MGEREAGREKKQVIGREMRSPVLVGTILYHMCEREACSPIDLIRSIFGFTCIFVLLSTHQLSFPPLLRHPLETRKKELKLDTTSSP